jgi:hypothetical protein
MSDFILFVYVGSEILTAVVIKNCISRDLTPRSLLKVNRYIGATPSGSKKTPSNEPG